ncbi:ATP-binding cassette domain-containing protein, partial [Campylobacter lari]
HIQVRGKNMHVYGYLKQFLFPKEFLEQSVSVLSGGEKNRVALALLFTKECDVLILDEPTNDLDIATINILEEYLLSFEGAILLVSHDRYFVDKIATKLYAFEDNANINIEVLSYSEYLENEKEYKDFEEFSKSLETNTTTSIKTKEKSSKKLSYKENEILNSYPDKIHKLEEEIKEIKNALSNPEFYQKIGINKLYEELKEKEENLIVLEEEYFKILEKFDR